MFQFSHYKYSKNPRNKYSENPRKNDIKPSRVHLYVIHSVDVSEIHNLNPLDEVNDFPVPNVGVVLEEIVEEGQNVGGAVLNLPMIEYPVRINGEMAMVEAMVEDQGSAEVMVEKEGSSEVIVDKERSDEVMVENEENKGDEGNVVTMESEVGGDMDGGAAGGTNGVVNEKKNIIDKGPTKVNETNEVGPTEVGGGINNAINCEGPSVVESTGEEGAKTGLEEYLWDGLEQINLGDLGDEIGEIWEGEQREDNALDISFDDSDEEIGDADNFGGEVGEEVHVEATIVQENVVAENFVAAEVVHEEVVGEVTQATQTKGEVTQGAASGSKPKSKRGRPKKQRKKSTEPVFEDEILAG